MSLHVDLKRPGNGCDWPANPTVLLPKKHGLSRNRSALADLIPLVHDDEMAHLKQELKGQQLAVCFDGTTNVAETYAIVVRWITPDFVVQQRWARLGFYRRSFKHQHITAVLNDVITRECRLTSALSWLFNATGL